MLSDYKLQQIIIYRDWLFIVFEIRVRINKGK